MFPLASTTNPPGGSSSSSRGSSPRSPRLRKHVDVVPGLDRAATATAMALGGHSKHKQHARAVSMPYEVTPAKALMRVWSTATSPFSRGLSQTEINTASARLHAMNFYLHYAAAERHRQTIQHITVLRAKFERGRQLLAEVRARAEANSDAVEEASTGVAHLESSVAEHKQRLDAALAEYDERIAAQTAAIQEQEALLQRLMRARLRTDAIVDGVVALLSTWLSGTFLARYLTGLISSIVARGDRRVNVLLRLALFCALARYLRELAVRAGVHSETGSLDLYAETFMDLLPQQIAELPTTLFSALASSPAPVPPPAANTNTTKAPDV